MSDDDRVLVLNCGSSSIKYQLIEPTTEQVLASGLAERIGTAQGSLVHQVAASIPETSAGTSARTSARFERPLAAPDHGVALNAVLAAFAEHGPPLHNRLVAVGHRVVHGGTRFQRPTVVDDAVLAEIEALSVLAPLHNPACAEGIRRARALLPALPHVAVFDTAFHATLPPQAATYAVPESWRSQWGVRRYGFHGTSHAYVARKTAQLLDRDVEQLNAIVLHLGNGASACAVSDGRSVDTSMGLTPLQGLVMGTRSGDVDPALPRYLSRVAGLTGDQVDDALNRESGLRGLTGVSDIREVLRGAEDGDSNCELALDLYCYRIRSYVGSYYAVLGRVDAVSFTAGVGENSPVVRARSLAGLDRLGISIDPQLNEVRSSSSRVISPNGSEVAVLVVPTDEECEIARQTVDVVRG